MKVYADAMFFGASGLGRLVDHLFGLLVEHPGVTAIEAAVPTSRLQAFLDRFDSPRIRPLPLHYGPMGVGDLVLKSLLLRRLSGRVERFLFPAWNVPLAAPRPDLVGIHDAIPFGPWIDAPAHRRLAFRWLLRRTARRARRIVTLSEAARDELAALLPVEREAFEVIPPWIDDRFFDLQGVPTEPGYLLSVGRRAPHKNLGRLLAAFESLAGELPGLRLVIAGPRPSRPDAVDRWLRRSRAAPRVELVDSPDDDRLRRLLAGATAFVFPSLSEGFGLPPLEAMAAGVPVICSEIPVLREVCGDAALFVDPTSTDSIAGGMRRALMDGDERSRLRRAGVERAARFRRERVVSAHRSLLDELVSSR